jgi:hypothetical protein
LEARISVERRHLELAVSALGEPLIPRPIGGVAMLRRTGLVLTVLVLGVLGTVLAWQAGPVAAVIQPSTGATPARAFPEGLAQVRDFASFSAPTSLPTVSATAAVAVACRRSSDWRAWLVHMSRVADTSQTGHLVWVVGCTGPLTPGKGNASSSSVRYRYFVMVDANTDKRLTSIRFGDFVTAEFRD